MIITKKAQILQLYNDGYKSDDIIKKGFTKKYVSQVLKDVTNTDPATTLANASTINSLKELVSTVEYLQNKYDGLNINISISIKVDSYNDIPIENKSELFNPVTTFRDIGTNALKEKLMPLSLKNLVKIAKTYTPDLSCKIYRKKDILLIVDYIVERATNLSRVGQVFRNVGNP
ncbi:MAG: hypothetical protein ACREVX_16130 [Clostridium sp.]|uniref:hypothetical protein n=1 Tax=Clostridium sp. TaxID=1506 RepID=UPI003D6D687C